jgi:hypothetical protein
MTLRILSLPCLLAVALATSGCESMGPSQRGGTLWGAAAGAGAGAILGNNVQGLGTREGAIAGALVGGLVGNQMGRQRDEIRELRDQANRATVYVTNSDGSRTPVVLRQVGENTWQGPRGELYTGFPSKSALTRRYAD